MTATLDETLAGADMEGGEVFCDDLYNNLKNNWRANYGGDPCGSAGLEYLQPGMLISDEYDNKLYHVTLDSDCPCSEILQACVPLNDDVYHGYGDLWESILGYDELTNDALILGIPVVDHRGLIICDQADVVPDITAAPYSLGTTTQPTIYMLDADEDSYFGIGHQVDDRPGIWSGPGDAIPVAIQYEANADVTIFENTAVDVNRTVYIYGSEDMVRLSALAAGGFGLRIDAYQDDITALTGLLRGAYIQASNGDEIATGTIRALELKARAGRPGEDGNDVAVLEGLSISADAKVYDITTVMRGAEVILDGALGASVVKAVGIRIANNFQADIATLSYGLEIYRDSFDYDADIALSSGGLIGGKAGHLRLSNTGVVEIWDATMTDRLFMYHDGTDAFIQWDNGALNLLTDEADTNSEIHIYGQGTGFGQLTIYDEDDAEFMSLYAFAGIGRITLGGVAPSRLTFLHNASHDIACWESIIAGNPNFRLYGWNTAQGGTIYTDFQMSDVNDEFLIETQNNANHEGITVSLLETNQRFRVRQNADYMAMYCTATDAYLTWSDGALNLQTDEVDVSSEVHIHGNGTAAGALHVYDEDDAEYLRFFCSAGIGYITTLGTAVSSLAIQHTAAIDIKYWGGIAAGNPNFYIYGWNTASATRRYSRFRMEDTYDEFFIEAEASANHEGITVSLLEAAQEFRLRGVGGAERFWIDQTGIVGYTRVGELRQWTYQGDLADEADFTLPAFTDACWGMIQAGDNEEYALFSVDNVGNVTLISNSANVVANANTDGKICLGIASPEEPLTVRNRLGATENINLIIWYS